MITHVISFRESNRFVCRSLVVRSSHVHEVQKNAIDPSNTTVRVYVMTSDDNEINLLPRLNRSYKTWMGETSLKKMLKKRKEFFRER